MSDGTFAAGIGGHYVAWGFDNIGDHWKELARRWELSGSPLRPGPDDVRAYREALAEPLGRREGIRVLILGVTPELYALPWPEGSDVRAADRSEAMIDLVWPGPPEAAHCEEWTELSLPDASRDVILCDGGFHLLAFPHGQQALVRTLRRVIADGGRFAVRLFVPPDESESPERVLDDLRLGRVENVNVLKLRLDMALQADPEDGVLLADVWKAFEAAEPDPEALATRVGWSPDEARSVEAYKGATSRYHFVTVEQVEHMFCRDPGGFSLESLRTATYELGGRFPVAVFRRGESAGRR